MAFPRRVQVDTVATTLSLAEQNHAEELKRVCLDFVSRNLQAVMLSEGYQHMVTSCPQLQVRLFRPCHALRGLPAHVTSCPQLQCARCAGLLHAHALVARFLSHPAFAATGGCCRGHCTCPWGHLHTVKMPDACWSS